MAKPPLCKHTFREDKGTHSHFPKTLTTVTADQKLKAPLLDPQVEEDVVGAM